MIHAFARMIADKAERRGEPRPSVHAEVVVCLNVRIPAIVISTSSSSRVVTSADRARSTLPSTVSRNGALLVAAARPLEFGGTRRGKHPGTQKARSSFSALAELRAGLGVPPQ